MLVLMEKAAMATPASAESTSRGRTSHELRPEESHHVTWMMSITQETRPTVGRRSPAVSWNRSSPLWGVDLLTVRTSLLQTVMGVAGKRSSFSVYSWRICCWFLPVFKLWRSLCSSSKPVFLISCLSVCAAEQLPSHTRSWNLIQEMSSV